MTQPTKNKITFVRTCFNVDIPKILTDTVVYVQPAEFQYGFIYWPKAQNSSLCYDAELRAVMV